jgi:hypothetical protein
MVGGFADFAYLCSAKPARSGFQDIRFPDDSAVGQSYLRGVSASGAISSSLDYLENGCTQIGINCSQLLLHTLRVWRIRFKCCE